jgi:hypothetical protein
MLALGARQKGEAFAEQCDGLCIEDSLSSESGRSSP